MKNFLILIRYKVPIDIVEQHTPDHRAFLRRRFETGYLLFSGPFVPRTAGVLWAQSATRGEVEQMISEDPFFVRGVADYETIEFSPTLHASTLDAVFQAQAAVTVGS